jgi:hypothetical protein
MSDLNTDKASIKISDLIRIHPNALRSIQVETDVNNQELSNSYVLTSKSRECLGRILLNLDNPSYGRSWTLTGPFGSGKSFFSLFLMNLVCSTFIGHQNATKQLLGVDPVFVKQISRVVNLDESKGLLPIPITGFRASIQKCLQHGFDQVITQLGNPDALASIKSELDSWSEQTNSHDIVRWIKAFTSKVKTTPFNYQGIVVIFDEMGKPLEFSATHSDEIDIYLLQELAEYANRSNTSTFIFIGILHQSFERYAATLDQTTQREWSKVQGRFEDIAFQEPPNQQTRLLANSIYIAKPEKIRELIPTLTNIIDESIEAGWCPLLMKSEEFQNLSETAYPFHPSVLVALPYLFKRLAQNERSIFAYLASFEPFGFQEFIGTQSPPTFLRLPDLFDYLVANFQARLYLSNRARALTETLERLSTAAELNSLEIEILKTIGLLNWLGEVSQIQANEGLLSSALKTDKYTYSEIHQALLNLKKRSIIIYRQYNQTYAVWQGSDVDLDERMDQANKQISGIFNLADAVQRYLPPRPLVARRHSFQTGTLRFFEVHYIGTSTLKNYSPTPKPGASGLVLLCLASNSGEISDFIKWAEQPQFRNNDGVLIGITKHTTRLYELLSDLRHYHWIEENTPELRDDKVAQKELFVRINSIETLIQNELDHSVSLHRLTDTTNCIWKYKGLDLQVSENVGISYILSGLCDERFSSSPIIWNELINRRTLSSQSARARRNLIEAMLTNSHLPQMAIDGYPPERSMYESIFTRGGLHKLSTSGQWEIQPPAIDDPLKLNGVWKAINDFIFVSPPTTQPLIELYKILGNPPFGITEGIIPVLICAFLQVHKEETTLYREGTLLAEPSVPDWEVLLRRPELFSIAGCRVTGSRLALVTRIARGLNTNPSVMSVVRELVRQLKSLPEYAWKTNKISREATALRRAVELAHSPEQLLFNDLPGALDLDPISGNQLDVEILEEFFNRLNLALSELATATPARREWARDVFLKACELPSHNEGWQSFIEISREMAGHITHPNLAPLIKRAAEAADPTSALESVLALIANRPMRTWTDGDVDRFSMLAQTYGSQFRAERNGFMPSLDLTIEQKYRSETLSKKILAELEQYQEDPQVLQGALQNILEYYRNVNKPKEK